MDAIIGSVQRTANTPTHVSRTHQARFSEKKRTEVQRWVARRATGRKYKSPTRQRPEGTAAGSSKRLAPRSHQLKMGHRLTGQCPKRTGNQPTAKYPYRTQTRKHVLTNRPIGGLGGGSCGRGCRRTPGGRTVCDPRPPRRCEVQPSASGFPLHYGCGEGFSPS